MKNSLLLLYIVQVSSSCIITMFPVSRNVTYNTNLSVVCKMKGSDCLELDVLKQSSGSASSDISESCTTSSNFKRHCHLTITEEITVWCKAIYGNNYQEKTSDKAMILVQSDLHPVKNISLNKDKTLSWSPPSNLLNGIDVEYTVEFGNMTFTKAVNTNSIVLNNSVLINSCLPINVSITAQSGIISSNKSKTIVYYPQVPKNCSILQSKITRITEVTVVLNVTYKCANNHCHGERATRANITITYEYSEREMFPNLSIVNDPEGISVIGGKTGILLNRKDTCNVSIVLINEAGSVSLELLHISTFDVSNITVDIGDHFCIQCYFVNYATTESCYVEIYGVTLVGITKGVTLKRNKTISERQCWKFSVKGSTGIVDIYVKDDINGEHWAFRIKNEINMTTSSMFPTFNSENNSNTPWKLIVGIIIAVVVFAVILITVIILSKFRFQIFQYFTDRIRKYKTQTEIVNGAKDVLKDGSPKILSEANSKDMTDSNEIVVVAENPISRQQSVYSSENDATVPTSEQSEYEPMDEGYAYEDPKPSTGSGPSGVAVGQTAEDHDVTLSLTNESNAAIRKRL